MKIYQKMLMSGNLADITCTSTASNLSILFKFFLISRLKTSTRKRNRAKDDF